MNLYKNLIIFGGTFLSLHILKTFPLKHYTFNTFYFLMHFIVNCIIVYMCLPYFSTMLWDPVGSEGSYEEYSYISNTFPILASLHTYHLYQSFRTINNDEILHHMITYIFWIINSYLVHPFYYVGLIWMSGVPGGLTYLMLFLQKNPTCINPTYISKTYINPKYINPTYISKININISVVTEKYYSMLINLWIRCPGCIIYGTLMYDRMIYIEERICPLHIFLILFSIINGIYFTTTIIESYYTLKFQNKK